MGLPKRKLDSLPCWAARICRGATNAKLRAVLIANTQYPLIAGSVERLKGTVPTSDGVCVAEGATLPWVTEFYERIYSLPSTNGTTVAPEFQSDSIRIIFNTQDEIQLIKVMNQLETQKMSETIRTLSERLMDQEALLCECGATSRRNQQWFALKAGKRMKTPPSVMKRESLGRTDYSIAIPHALSSATGR